MEDPPPIIRLVVRDHEVTADRAGRACRQGRCTTQRLDVAATAALVAKVRASIVRAGSAALDDLAAALPEPVVSMSLRTWPPDSPTTSRSNAASPYGPRADAIMYRQVLSDLAPLRSPLPPRRLGRRPASWPPGRRRPARPSRTFGPPWTQDHRLALPHGGRLRSPDQQVGSGRSGGRSMVVPGGWRRVCSGRPATSASSPCRRWWSARTSSWWAATRGRRQGGPGRRRAVRHRAHRRDGHRRRRRPARARPDCVVYNPMWLDVDEMVRILEAGVNMVVTAAFITGLVSDRTASGSSRRASGRQRRSSAAASTRASSSCSRSSLAGVGSHRQDHDHRVGRHRGLRLARHRDPVGFGRPIDDPELPAMTATATAVFEDAVALVGDALGVEFDEIVCEAEYAKTTEDLDLGSWRSRRGAWPASRRTGRAGSAGRTIVELRPLAEGPPPRARLADRHGLPHRDPGPPDPHDQDRHPPPPDFEAPRWRSSWCSASSSPRCRS